MKKLLSLIVLLTLLLSAGGTVYANSMDLETSVPEMHRVSIESDGGRIVSDGTVCGTVMEEKRHEKAVYWILPDEGKVLNALIYEGEDVTDQVTDGVFAAPSLVRDTELQAVFAEAPDVFDDRTYNLDGTVEDEIDGPVSGITVEIGGKSKETDESGNFSLKKVGSGIHTIVIMDEDENIIGHGQLTIARAEGGKMVLTEDEQGNPVIRPARNTKNIRLVLRLEEDGRITVKEVENADLEPVLPGDEPTSPENDPSLSGDEPASGDQPLTEDQSVASVDEGKPATGDGSMPEIWGLVLMAACGVLAAAGFRMIRRRF